MPNTKKNFKKYIFIIILVILIIIAISIFMKSTASTQLKQIEKFPESYRPYLRELAKKHPNWEFTPLYTDLDWNYVISQENIYGKNLVPLNYTDSWKNTKPGEYNVEIDSGWVDSSKQAVEYCMDPRNFLNEVRIFQFEELSFNSYVNNLEGIEKILYGTQFYRQTVSYLDSSGNTITMSEKYSDLILKAGKNAYVSPYHLASRIKQEVGPFLTHPSISGDVEGFKGLYNFYNIGATSSSEPMGAIKNGLQYARDGKGASQDTKNKYLIPWNNKDKAITGGGIFIGSSYINKGQNTVYLQKFHVYSTDNNGLFWHQYMTNVLAPYSESKAIYNGYYKIGLLDTEMNFVIPVYENMPEIPTQSPTINNDNYIDVQQKVCSTGTNVNIRTGPSTSYEIITTVDKNEQFTRIKKGVQSGDKWDKVILENGIVGFIAQQYVQEVDESQVDNELTITDTQISGLDYKNNTVTNISLKLEPYTSIKIYNHENKLLNENDLVGTGSKVVITKTNNEIKEYEAILYGDVNGDGKINSVDLLILQRHILEIKKLDEIFITAGNVRKDGTKPSSVDLLLIQRHILGLQIIDQKSKNSEQVKEENIETIQSHEEYENKNTNLETLAIENVLLYPAFDNSITSYTAEISGEITKLNMLAIPENEEATAIIEGNEDLKEGDNLITVKVLSKDKTTEKVYEINVIKNIETSYANQHTISYRGT